MNKIWVYKQYEYVHIGSSLWSASHGPILADYGKSYL